jgi:secreted trypsin-like serine protease
LKLLVRFLVAIIATLLIAAPARAGIVGGELASREYPFMASVQSTVDGHYCGGSLVAPEWVLTAAHCGEGEQPANLEVLIGVTDLDDAGERIAVTEIRTHPAYDSGTLRNDVALLRLARPSAKPPVRLVRPGQEAIWAPGQPATAIGWGEHQSPMQPGSYTDGDSSVLREVTVPVVADADCADTYDENKEFLTGGSFDPASMVCAGDGTGGRDSCYGDSGGPLLVAGDVQVGVVSWGYECALPSFYGIYARIGVPVLHDWIAANVPAPAAPAARPAPPATPASAGVERPRSRTVRSAKAYRACVKKAQRKRSARSRRAAIKRCAKYRPAKRR